MKYFFILMTLVMMTLAACDNDAVIPNEEELITNLTYTLISATPADTVILSFTDPNGDGGISPVITTDTLQSNVLYQGNLTLTNASVMPVVDITQEIDDEAADHQFFYTLSSVALGTILYQDEDANGYPVGLKTGWQTAQPNEGTLRIILRHQPDKTIPNVTPGTAGGETDIEVNFPVYVK